MKILSFGEIIWDVYPDRRALGGAPLNFAVHCAARGGEAFMISAVGNDELGCETLDAVKSKNVAIDYIFRNSQPTGCCNVTLDQNKVPSYDLMNDTAYDFIELSDGDIADIANAHFNAVCFGTLIQRSPISRASLNKLVKNVHFETVFCDVNLRKGNYDTESALFCLESANVLKISLEEAPALTALGIYSSPKSDTPRALSDTLFENFEKLNTILLTDGEKGAYSVDRGEEPIFLPAKKVKVVSTVGAGDSFGAAWLISRFSGDSASLALQNAVNYSADVISGKV